MNEVFYGSKFAVKYNNESSITYWMSMGDDEAGVLKNVLPSECVEVFENEPVSGIKLSDISTLSDNYANGRCGLIDPRGFEVDVQMSSVIFLLAHLNYSVEAGFDGECVYMIKNKAVFPVPINSDIYRIVMKRRVVVNGVDEDSLLPPRLVERTTYISDTNKKYIYLGEFPYYAEALEITDANTGDVTYYTGRNMNSIRHNDRDKESTYSRMVYRLKGMRHFFAVEEFTGKMTICQPVDVSQLGLVSVERTNEATLKRAKELLSKDKHMCGIKDIKFEPYTIGDFRDLLGVGVVKRIARYSSSRVFSPDGFCYVITRRYTNRGDWGHYKFEVREDVEGIISHRMDCGDIYSAFHGRFGDNKDEDGDVKLYTADELFEIIKPCRMNVITNAY